MPGDELVRVPRPPDGLLEQSLEAWVTYWTIPETSMLRPHHLPALRRLVCMYDEEERIRRRVDEGTEVAMNVPVGMDGTPTEGEIIVEYEPRMVRLPGHLGIGSQGQVVTSPDFSALMKLRERIQALEDRFAATPLAEFRVGWQRAAMLNEESKADEAAALAEAARQIAEQHAQLRGGTAELPAAKKTTRKPTRKTTGRAKKKTSRKKTTRKTTRKPSP
jgi:hypothetical protein